MEGLNRLEVYQMAMDLAKSIYRLVIPNLPLKKSGVLVLKFGEQVPVFRQILQKVMGAIIIKKRFGSVILLEVR